MDKNGKIRIAILAESFIDWSGGIEFLKYIMLGLRRNPDYEFHLYIPNRNTTSHLFKNSIKTILNLVFKNKYKIIRYPKVKITSSSLANYLDVSNYTVYKNRRQLISLLSNQCDIALPAYTPFTEEIHFPYIGYVFDIQHKYFPDFFSQKELEQRDLHFYKHVKYSQDIIVNSEFVKNDLLKFYLSHNKVHSIPFTPIFNLDLYTNTQQIDVVKLKYDLEDKPYFIICNQFWKHKGHLTAIKALLILIKDYKVDCNLVITGVFDYNANPHCKSIWQFVTENNLTDNVKFLGFIEKSDQLSLVLNSCAVVQPTQFEGGAGGFIVFEALAYNHRCIVSDIEVNKEINSEFVSFFKVNDSEDLAIKMKNCLETTIERSSLAVLNANFEANRLKLEKFWACLIDVVLNKKDIKDKRL